MHGSLQRGSARVSQGRGGSVRVSQGRGGSARVSQGRGGSVRMSQGRGGSARMRQGRGGSAYVRQGRGQCAPPCALRCLAYQPVCPAHPLYPCPGQDYSNNSAWQSALALGVLNATLSWLMLSFFSSVLLNVVDALFVCWALDRDHASCCRPDVAQVYSALPG